MKNVAASPHFTFHVIGLPHTQTTKAYSTCAFTQKVRKFCDMMKSLGHTVYLYASEDNEAACDELITCITKQEQHDMIGVDGPEDVLKMAWGESEPHFQLFNARAMSEVAQRAEPRDFICLMGGLANRPFEDAFPQQITLEFGIGYPGSFAKFRVFESYPWMHASYGAQQPLPSAQGGAFDRVIPSYFEKEDFQFFPHAREEDPYFLFIGRLTPLKGYEIAVETTRRLGATLLVAGQGDPPAGDHVRYLGILGPDERNVAMGGAIATFVPTLYVEPFGSVACESMMTGTPVITTDWGAFTDTVTNGLTGYRCRLLRDFVRAAKEAPALDRAKIRRHAVKRWAMENVRWQYQEYFEDLSTLWEDGWYSE